MVYEILEVLLPIVIPIGFGAGPLLFSWIAGNTYQKRKMDQVSEREKTTMAAFGGRDPLTSTVNLYPSADITHGRLLTANVSIGPSWWQFLLASLKKLVGGRIYVFDRVLEFGRREALQRLREIAQAEGVDHVINVRLDTAMIVVNKGGDSKTGAMEIFAYGTGVHVAKPAADA